MKHLVIALVLFLISCVAKPQYTLRLVVNEVSTKKLEDIYVAGSFNNWNPKDEKFKLKPIGTTRRGIVIKDLAAGKYEFKFTRGSFDKVETTAKGEDIPNREILIKDDISLDHNIPGWKDDFPDKLKPNTTTAQVKVIDTAFSIPQLNRSRRIWVYLPKSYSASTKRYSVIYMHDGQNLFNEQTAPYGEWGVDETIDSVSKQTGKEAIVVGIDHGGEKRMNEYNPFDHKQYGKGEGKEYVDFLVLTLKPYIDNKFRTLKDSAHTFVAGSSMGGLISTYAMVRYPNVFGGAGIFSPAFWTAPAIYESVAAVSMGRAVKRFYFYAGGQESNVMVPDMDKMIRVVEKKGNYETRRVVMPVAKHNEAAWRKVFADFYNFVIR